MIYVECWCTGQAQGCPSASMLATAAQASGRSTGPAVRPRSLASFSPSAHRPHGPLQKANNQGRSALCEPLLVLARHACPGPTACWPTFNMPPHAHAQMLPCMHTRRTEHSASIIASLLSGVSSGERSYNRAELLQAPLRRTPTQATDIAREWVGIQSVMHPQPFKRSKQLPLACSRRISPSPIKLCWPPPLHWLGHAGQHLYQTSTEYHSTKKHSTKTAVTCRTQVICHMPTLTPAHTQLSTAQIALQDL
jgi:hypothetical protein